MKTVNPHKTISTHIKTGEPVDLKWYRGASRYNNGATMFGKKYMFRYRMSIAKQHAVDKRLVNLSGS